MQALLYFKYNLTRLPLHKIAAEKMSQTTMADNEGKTGDREMHSLLFISHRPHSFQGTLLL